MLLQKSSDTTPNQGRLALLLGGAAAILASTCCLGPLVLLLLGFSGAWIGSDMAPRILVAVAACATALAAFASPVTVVLSVPSMDCPVCPITVRKALTGVTGVRKASVDFERRQATVTFDDSQTGVEALTRATGNAGYPSTLAGAASR